MFTAVIMSTKSLARSVEGLVRHAFVSKPHIQNIIDPFCRNFLSSLVMHDTIINVKNAHILLAIGQVSKATVLSLS